MEKRYRLFSPLLLLLLVHISSLSAQINLLQIEFVQMPAGKFQMGTADLDEIAFETPPNSSLVVTDEQPVHPVLIDSFMLGKYEITQQQWYRVMQTRPGPDEHWQRPDWQQLPVVSISWDDTQAFIKRLNKIDTQFQYRLPTEAEWEYAARSGSASLRPFDLDELENHAWSLSNSGDIPHPVGQKKISRFGLYDMFGNAWEWVNDWYQPNAYQQHAMQNPMGPKRGELKVRRGGSYHCASHLVRSAYRAADKPSQRYSVLGFRLVKELKPMP